MHRGNCLCYEVVQAGEEGGGRVRLQAVYLGQDITTQGTEIISSTTTWSGDKCVKNIMYYVRQR